jgi:hypothetical protein
LGLSYADSGNKEKALESLEESVRLCQLENRDPESFTYKEAKRKVEELKTEKESNTL